MVAALYDLDGIKGVAQRIAATRTAVDHIYGDAFDRQGVVGNVDAFAAEQLVGAATADQRVVARSTDQHVVPALARDEIVAAITFDRVVEIGPDHVLDRDQHVAFGLTAPGGAVRQRNRDSSA